MTERTPKHAADVSHRIRFIFTHPKPDDKKNPPTVAVDLDWLMENGIPLTQKGKRWIYDSVVLIQ